MTNRTGPNYRVLVKVFLARMFWLEGFGTELWSGEVGKVCLDHMVLKFVKLANAGLLSTMDHLWSFVTPLTLKCRKPNEGAEVSGQVYLRS